MFSFKTSFFTALLTTGAYASIPSLHVYEPGTPVADHAAISIDQAAIDDFVGFDSTSSFDAAKDVYTMGGNSKSFMEMTVPGGIPSSIRKGDTMAGTTAEGKPVDGIAYSDYAAGTELIRFQYAVGQDYENHVLCRVGGLPTELQMETRCLSDSGSLTIQGVATPVTYTGGVNKNGRTLQGFSTTADVRMKPGDDTDLDYFPFFEPYIEYYGTHDFADQIALAGFQGTNTNLNKGNIKLSSYGFRARAEIAKKATAYLNAGIYSIREVYDAIHDCQEDCLADTSCNDDAVHALDEAVAFYVGSEYVTDPDGLGNMFFGLAEKRAANFATAEDGTAGQSMVNKQLFLEYNDMKAKLDTGKCPETEANAEEIVRLMQIPLIQGTLRYAYILATKDSPSEKDMAEGAIFAAGILPNVNKCNEDAATTIYENMRLKNTPTANTDFAQVKNAFESVYGCLRVSCADIGGLVDPATGNTYYEGAAPCGGVFQLSGSGAGAMTYSMVAMTLGAVGAVAALFM